MKRIKANSWQSPVAKLGAILFDCDGVLADTERDGHRIALNMAMKEKGLKVGNQDMKCDEKAYGELLEIGRGRLKLLEFWKRHGWDQMDLDLAAEIYARKKEIFNELVAAQKIPLRPGVNYIVDEAIAAGIKLAVCSSSDDRAVEYVVGLMGKERASHVRIFSASSITKPKPSPEVYTVAARALGVRPEDCVAIEDSSIGLQAANAAGISCIICPSSYTAHQDFKLADLVVGGLNELDLETIIRQARSTQFDLTGANC